ncbi:T9SS type A sorting domain-containing protein [Flavobacterium sp.]|uniref:T9SS type A sorting domain-containing protein n=1 Tax=Flavobacterium sp. TaxID=239 RepID=UPI00375163C6
MKTKLLFLVILFSLKALAQVPTANLDSEYQFTGGSLNDTYGTAENLTRTGSAATFTTDRFGATSDAINLAGDNLSRVPVQSTTSLSMSFWVKSATSDANFRTIMEQSQRVNTSNDSSSRGWYVYLRNGIVSLSCNYLWRWTANGGLNTYTGHSSWWDCSSSTNIADNNWHHVAITITGRSYYNYAGAPNWAFENVYKIYVDNVLKNTITRTYNATTATGGNSTSSPDFLPNNNLIIGNNSFGNLASANRYMDQIDDIRFYKTTLTPANVTSLFTEATLSTTDFNEFSDFSIYPNPSNSIVNIASQEVIETIEVFTLDGRKIKSCNAAQIDISDLSNGMYLMQVKTAEGKLGIKKIIKN